MKRRYFVIAEGNVQGVGFRFFVQQNAVNLFISGWVENMSDGTVHMEIQGNKGNLDLLINRLKVGDRFITVDKVTFKEIDCIEGSKDFVIAN